MAVAHVELCLQLLQHLDSSLGRALGSATCLLDLWGWSKASLCRGPGSPPLPTGLCQAWHLVAFISNNTRSPGKGEERGQFHLLDVSLEAVCGLNFSDSN